MKNLIINNSLNYIKKYNNYDEDKIAIIKYGLEAIYLTISKFLIISIAALVLGIFKEMVIYMLIYNILRLPSFGLHATKSWICLLSSTTFFIGVPYLCILLKTPIIIKVVICIIGICLMFKNSPADTYKRPIVSKKRRTVYKFLSTILTIIYAFLAIFITNNFIANCLLFSIIMQNLMISPTVYKMFKLPYNNYKTYIKNHPELQFD